MTRSSVAIQVLKLQSVEPVEFAIGDPYTQGLRLEIGHGTEAGGRVRLRRNSIRV
jgi:hypothetical protein